MLLESNGIRIEVKSPAEIHKMKAAGYVEVKGVKPKPEPKSREDLLADIPEEGAKLPAQVKLAMEALELEKPEDLSLFEDKALLKIKGIGRGALKSIRVDYPFISEADEAPEGGDNAEAGEGD